LSLIRRAFTDCPSQEARAHACCALILATDFLNGPSDSGLRPFLCSRLFEGNHMT
jgi:hypothetical protein